MWRGVHKAQWVNVMTHWEAIDCVEIAYYRMHPDPEVVSARLFTRGFQQREGIDNTEVVAPATNQYDKKTLVQH